MVGTVIISSEEYRSLIKDSIKLAEMETADFKSLVQDSCKLAELKDDVAREDYLLQSEIRRILGVEEPQGKEE